MHQRIRKLEVENADLKREIAALTVERDTARRTAEEVSHVLTYVQEQMHCNPYALRLVAQGGRKG